MPRKRKTPSREELRRLARRKRVADAWMAGASASAIAKSERVSVAAVYADLRAASDVILPAGTKEQLLARNFERLEAVIAANRKGMQAGEAVATANVTKAIAEQNKMLGVTNGAVNNFTVNAGHPENGSNDLRIEVNFPREIQRADGSMWIEGQVPDDPPPEPPRQILLLEYRPSSDAVPLPPEALPRPPEPPRPPPQQLNQGGTLIKGDSPYATELDLPPGQRLGFSSDESRLWKKRPRNW